MKKFTNALLFALTLFSLDIFAQVPTITSFSPLSGSTGTSVVLTGTGFSTTPANNIVRFGPVKATVTAATSTSCNVTVPVGAAYASITIEVNGLTGYSQKAFIVTNSCPAPITSTSFDTSGFTSASGSNPYYSSFGDFDDDGKTDYVISCQGSASIKIYRNTSSIGAISSILATSKTTGNSPRGSASGDLNGDGKLDIAVYSYNLGSISIFQNTSVSGTISFANNVSFNVGNGGAGNYVAIGDIDGDGKPDIVCSKGLNDSLVVLRNTNTTVGSAFTASSFATYQKFYCPSNPVGVGICDIDGDGKMDIVASNNNSNNISVFRNIGSVGNISLAAAVNFATAPSPLEFSIGDIDLDGKPDIAVAANFGDKLSILKNTSVSGTISFATKVDFATGTNPRNTTITDINGDGLPDVVLICAGTDEVDLFQNASSPGVINSSSFLPVSTFILPVGNDARQLSIGDLDGDGKPDMVSMSQTEDRILTYRNLIFGGPVMTSADSKTICSGTAVGHTLTASPSSGTTFSWIAASNSSVSGEQLTTATTSSISNTLTNTTNTAQDVVYTVTPSSSTTCAGGTPQPQTVTVTVNPKPAINAMTNTACSGTSFTSTPADVTNGTIPSGTTYTWTAPSVTGSMTGGVSGSGSSITGTLTNSTNTSQTATYTVTPTTGSCSGSTFTLTVTINPKPAINAMTNTACSATSFTSIPVNTTNGTVPTGTTYTWTAPSVTGSMTGGVSGSGTSITGTLTNPTNTAQTATYSITPTSGTCNGSTFTLTITVNPKATINPMTTTICTGVAFTSTPANSVDGTVPSGTTYSWTSPSVTGSMTGGTSGSGTSITGTLTNNLATAKTATYTVTPTSGSCVGSIFILTATVNPKPAINDMTVSVCSGIAFTTTPVNNTNGTVPTGTTYSWTAPSVTGSMTGGVSGSGSSITGTLTNSTITAQTATYTITPTSGTCNGSTFTLTITVNPKATINAMTTTICTGVAFTSTPANSVNGTVPSGTTYSWTSPSVTGSMTGGTSGSGTDITGTLTNNLVTAKTATYTITPTSGSCVGSIFTLTATVNPKPAINDMTVNVCSGIAFTTTPVNNTNGTVPTGTTYSWNAPSVTGSMTGGTAGSGASITGTLTNSTNTAQTATYTVTPTSGTCDGSTFTLTITVNPKPAINAMTNTACSGTSFTSTPANTTNGIVPTGTTYTWTAPTVTGSMAGGISGSGSSITGTLINITNTAQTATYTVTPTSGSCSGLTFTLTVTINPKPAINAMTNTACSATSFTSTPADVTNGTIPSGTTYTWTAPSVTGSMTGGVSGSGSSITGTLTNPTNSAQTATYTVTPTSGSCSGPTFTLTVTVNPKPAVTAMTSSVCTGNSSSSTPVDITNGVVPVGTTYTWATPTVTGSMTGGTSGSVANDISGTFTNSTNTAQTATYTVTPVAGSCTGSTFTITTTVNPKPNISTMTNAVCSGTAFTSTPANSTNGTVPSGTSYSWSAPSVTGSMTGSVSGSGLSITGTLTNNTNTAQTATYIVTPTSGSCAGSTFNLTVTVNPKPNISAMSNQICSGNTFTTNPLNTTNGIVPVGTTYSWPTPSISGSATGGTSGSGSSITGTLTNTTTTSPTATYTITPVAGSCTGATFQLVATVRPIPAMTSNNSTTICSGSNINLPLTSNIASNYSWSTSDNASTTGESTTSQNNDTLDDVIVNTTNTSQLLVYAVTPTSVTGSCVGSSQNVTISIDQQPTIANAGSDQTVCTPTALLQGNTPTVGSGVWTWIGGPPPTIGAASYPGTTIGNLINGAANAVTMRWTTSNGVCASSFDDVIVTYDLSAPVCLINADFYADTVTNCLNTNVVFTNNSNGASTYSWNFGAGATPLTANTAGPHNVTYSSSGFKTISLSITGPNGSDTETKSNFIEVLPAPTALGAISGLTTLCAGSQQQLYSIPPNSTAASYNWTLPAGATIHTGVGTASISVNYANNATNGNITVTGVNACGSGTSNTQAITVNPLPGDAGAIGGTNPVCQGISSTYSITPVSPAATDFVWTFPLGVSASSITNSANANITTSAQSGIVTVTPHNGCGYGLASQINLVVNPIPAAAGNISGNSVLCQGDISIYTVASIANATNYIWTFPSGAGAISPDDSATVTFSSIASSGNITVVGNNACGNGASSSAFAVTVNPLATALGSISGNIVPCVNTQVLYSVPLNSTATSYNWVLPSGATINTGAGTSSISVNYASNALSGNIMVNGVNGCGSGAASSRSIIVNQLPGDAGIISGSNPVCQNLTNVNYSIVDVSPTATDYMWSFPSGITSSGTANSVNANISTSALTGIVTVTPHNGCGYGAASQITLTVDPIPADAGNISGSTVICAGDSAIYSIVTISNATNYIWTFPSGANANSPNDSAAVNFNATASSGTISVVGNNACGNGSSSPAFTVVVNPLPGAAGPISGNDSVCIGASSQSYSVSAISGATSYNWNFPNGVSALNPNNNASVDISLTAQNGAITVEGVNGCGVGVSNSMNIVINPLPDAASVIIGPDSVCQGQSSVVYYVNNINNANSYVWTFPAGTSGIATSNSFTVDFLNNALSGDITVTGRNTCGDGVSSTYAIIVKQLPGPIAFTNAADTSIAGCPLPNNLSFSTTGSANANAYTWYLSDSLSLVTYPTPNSIVVNTTEYSTSDTLKISASNECGASNTAVKIISRDPLPTNNICLVTVDTLSTHNIIIWDKPVSTTINSFNIYRVQTASIDTLVGNVAYGALSEFHDNSCDPNVTQYDYKISVVDSCGNEGEKSPFHRTILMTTSVGFGQVNLNWNQYVGNAVNQYRVWRDSTLTGNWQLLANLSPASTTYIDNSWPGTAAWRYRIDVDWVTACTPTARTQASTINTTRSNTKDNYRITGLSQLNSSDLSLYPNPASDLINIKLNANVFINRINISDASGRLIKSINVTCKNNVSQINTSDLTRGIYIIEISTNAGPVRKSFVRD